MQQNLNQPVGNEMEENFAAMFEASLKDGPSGGLVKEGAVVKGTVIRLTKEFAVVDIGYKSEGQIPLDEFKKPSGEIVVKRRVTRSTCYIESRENDTGMVVLSKEKADKMRIWDEISNAVKGDEIVKGTIVGRVKGGLSVDIGVKAFLPGSQVDIRPVRNLDQFLGKEFEFKVIKFNKKRGNIVLSRRVLLEKQREEQKKETLKNLKEGAIMKGHGQEPHRLRRLHRPRRHRRPAAHHRHVVGPRRPPVARCSTWATRCAWSSSSSTPPPSASAWASSRSRKTRGTAPTRSTRSAPASRARSSASPTTAPSSSSSRASRAWSTSPR